MHTNICLAAPRRVTILAVIRDSYLQMHRPLRHPLSHLNDSPQPFEQVVFEQEVLHPAVTDTVIKKAVAKFKAAQQEKTTNIDRYCVRISQLDIEIKRLVSAVSAGGDIPALVVALKENTDRRAALSDELAELNKLQGLDQTDYDELEAELRAHFRQSWEALMTRQVAQARQILAKLFNGERVPFSPAGSGYEFTGTASIGRLLVGHAKGLVSPTGFSIGGSNILTFQIDVRALVA
jgi:hypothetical protein